MRLFDGKVAVITGATGGIGGATAKLLAREGAKLALGYHSGTDRARGISKECEELGAETMQKSQSTRLFPSSFEEGSSSKTRLVRTTV